MYPSEQTAKKSSASIGIGPSELGQIENKSDEVAAEIMAANNKLKQILSRLRGERPEIGANEKEPQPTGSIARIRLTLHNAGVGISRIHELIEELEKII